MYLPLRGMIVDSARGWQLISAQKGATKDSGRIGQRIPAQAATFFRSAQKRIPRSRAERCHGGFRADWATDSRAGSYIFPFRAEKDTPFLRRKVPRRIPGGLGNGFPRRRLHFSVPRRKRYPVPAQKSATKDTGRIGQRIPAQAATFFRSAQKRIPRSRAERCLEALREQ